MPFPKRVYNVILNINSEVSRPPYKVKRYDSFSTQFNFQLVDNLIPINLTDIDVKITVKKYDGTETFQTVTVTEAEEGMATVLLNAETLSVAGIATAEISLYGVDDERLTFFEFLIDVDENLDIDDAIESGDYLPALTEAISSANEALESAHTHSNKTVLDKIAYAGSASTVNLADTATANQWLGMQMFRGGVVINSARLAMNTSGATPDQAKYYHIARIIINGSFNRVTFTLDYFGTGTTPKKGSIEGYVYSTSNYSTISVQTFVQTYVRDKFAFGATDIKIVKSASAGAGKTIWDIYVWLSDYGTAYVNGLYGFTESGELIIDPDNGAVIETANLPAVSSTFTYGGQTYTVSAVDNGAIRTYTSS